MRNNNHRVKVEQVGKLDDEAGAGAADMVSMILRGLVIQLTTPDEFRGRMSAVNAMFVISGPMLGQFESGLVAGLFTPELSVISGGVACILATLATVAFVPGLLRVKVEIRLAVRGLERCRGCHPERCPVVILRAEKDLSRPRT